MKNIIFKIFSSKLLLVGWFLIIFVLCTLPSKSFENHANISDKHLHILAFAPLSFLWFFQSSNKYKILVYCVFYGIFIEFWQYLLPESFHRGFELLDMLADSLGSLVGFGTAYVVQKYVFKNG